MKARIPIVVLAALFAAVPVAAQWLNYPAPDVPRTKDGKPNLSTRAPRARNGEPDLSGIWRAAADPQGKPEGVENEIFPRHFLKPLTSNNASD